MNETNQSKKVTLLNKEWRAQKNAGFKVKRYIPDIAFDEKTGKEYEVEVEVEIHIFGGTEDNQMRDLVLKKDADGEFLRDGDHFVPVDDPEGRLGESAVVSISIGLPMSEVDEIRRNKSRRFWNALILECNKYNGISLAGVETEKNVDEPAP